jgi:hypothetical protein
MDYKAIAAWGWWPTIGTQLYQRVSSWGYGSGFGAPVVSAYPNRPTYTTIALAGRMRL